MPAVSFQLLQQLDGQDTPHPSPIETEDRAALGIDSQILKCLQSCGIHLISVGFCHLISFFKKFFPAGHMPPFCRGPKVLK